MRKLLEPRERDALTYAFSKVSNSFGKASDDVIKIFPTDWVILCSYSEDMIKKFTDFELIEFCGKYELSFTPGCYSDIPTELLSSIQDCLNIICKIKSYMKSENSIT